MPREKVSLSVALSVSEMERLRGYAEKFGCEAITGSTAGQPSVRRFIASLAAGRFVVSDRLAHGKRSGPALEPVVRRTASGAVIGREPKPEAPKQPEDSKPPEKPIWWGNDETETPVFAYPVAELPADRVEEARAAGIEEVDGEFRSDPSWYPPEEPPEPSLRPASAEFLMPPVVEPAWWPANGATRGDLVDLLVAHGECGSAAGVDAWIEAQGEWQKNGTVFVRASKWTNPA